MEEKVKSGLRDMRRYPMYTKIRQACRALPRCAIQLKCHVSISAFGYELQGPLHYGFIHNFRPSVHYPTMLDTNSNHTRFDRGHPIA